MSHTSWRRALMVLTTLCAGCLTDPELKMSYDGFTPEQLGNGWTIAAPAAVGMDAARLDEVYRSFFSEAGFPTLRALLVVRHGRLVAEGYSRDTRDRDRYQTLQSATKSITSLLAGMAMQEGLAPSLDTPLYDLMPAYFDDDVRKRSITLRHVLTMRTGLRFHNEEDSGPFVRTPGSSVRDILHRPLEFEPGSTFYYNDGTPQLVAGLFMASLGMTLEEYARDRLFGPLGVVDYQWEHPADGLSFGAYGLWLRPRDMARLGQLVLQDGVWQGRRLVPAGWLDASTRVYANGDYGFYWWVLLEGRVYYASGAGSQKIFVDEDQDLVIVLLGDPGARDWVISRGVSDLFDGIYGAITGP